MIDSSARTALKVIVALTAVVLLTSFVPVLAALSVLLVPAYIWAAKDSSVVMLVPWSLLCGLSVGMGLAVSAVASGGEPNEPVVYIAFVVGLSLGMLGLLVLGRSGK